MPIIWRYLLRSYFQVLALWSAALSPCSRPPLPGNRQIRLFWDSQAQGLDVCHLQIPYILPIAIPVSCLITAMLLFQRLSKTHELTAFRTCGLRP